MKKFEFRLQRILDLRGAREKTRLMEFGWEQQKLLGEQQKLALFVGEKNAQISEMTADRAEPFSAWSLQAGHRYMRRLEHVIDFQQQRIRQQTDFTEKARQIYLDAKRDTTILDKLREKKRGEWEQAVLAQEAKALDEIGSLKRRKIEGDL
jgi:flagellar export protein FliJ